MDLNLSFLGFFDDVGKATLKAVEHEVEWFCLPAGHMLFAEGEPSDAFYLLRSGALAAFRDGAMGRPNLLGYIRAGEPVGEMSMLEERPHSASVYAMRDSEIVRLPTASFERLADKHPSLMRELSKMMLRRLRSGPQRDGSEPRVFALVSCSPTIDLDYRAKELQTALARIGVTCAIVGDEAADWQGPKLDAFERDHHVVLLAAKLGDSNWARRAMGRADRVWLLARGDARPSTPLLPDDPSPAARLKLLDVVLVHDGGKSPASRPQEWADAAEAARVFHWRQERNDDLARLARTLAGKSVGLVLSGGGARAYAHIGAIDAFRKAGMEFDFIGGASMGAIIAAGVALEWSQEELVERVSAAFVASNPLGDWQLPVISLSRGRRVDERLEEHFGDVEISDMSRPFFCVSSNLSNGRPFIHRRGRLRDALRASIAIPGILPPVIDGENVLVDGAVFTNFPSEQMKAFHRGVSAGSDVTRAKGVNPSDFRNPPGFFGWVRQHGLNELPPIASLLMRSATAGVMVGQHQAFREAVDLLVLPETETDLRQWKLFEDTVDSGRRAAEFAMSELSRDELDAFGL
ncbi:patatin-like phospholipase family protein [Hyphobacterium sp. CCMP332]|uniref:patatin-like phospholipase family protein n=1 Tax=Hyphobacterium sp. CCMP332 TaxID=2749086 RepID=UPI0016509147|nr:patatin-like phospholipase family protein [Hyphobacterium sp. CCMP332]QNL18936.1 patatin-like phospholipase family protein [Hyphobacterium sp. CCMP332]